MDDIGLWLSSLGLERYIDAFRKQELDLQSITLLSNHDLEEMGVALGPRKKILNAIASLPPAGLAALERVDAPAAERRYLTVLFADMVASTEYADRLDPEDFRGLLELFLETCSAVLKRHKGLVASYIGDAVSAYFGYPVANEDDSERAMLAGFEILEAVAAVAEAQGQPLKVRLGVASGQVVVGNFLGAPAGVSTFAFGHVAHLAARLQALAQPNTILADGATYQAANGAIEFVDFGKHDLKGFIDPIQVWQARQPRSLPSRFAKRKQLTKLCGRDAEVRRLMRTWDEISERRTGQVVWVSGEAGIGKSRLLHEVQRRLQNSPQMLLQCNSAFENSTLYPFLTELKRHAGIEDIDAAEDKLLKLRTALSISKIPIDAVLPILANLLSIPSAGPEAVSDIGSEYHRAITKQFFIDWISHLAHTKPLLLIFEDEQWADQTSRQLLNALVQNLAFIPVLLLVSVRTDHEVALSESEGSFQLKLDPLSSEDATALVRDLSPVKALSDELVAFILNRAEGVPLYIEELTQSALEIGASSTSSLPQISSSGVNIPNTLQSMLLARLDRLGRAKEIAQIAAMIGREFNVDILREVSRLPESDVEVALTNLVDSGLIVRKEGVTGSRYSFKHALLQQAAERTILRERSQKLHALIGETMLRADPDASAAYPELLAQHFAEGGVYDRAADYWLLAGMKAGKTWAKIEAAQMFGRGIEAAKMLPDSPERSRRLLQLELERGDVLYRAFGYVTGEGTAAYHRAIQISEKLGDPEAPIRALDGLFGTHFNSSQYSDAIGASDRLIDIGESRNNIKALVLGFQFKGMSLFCCGQLTSAQLYLERALSYKARADEVDSDFPSMTMIYLSWTLEVLGNHDKALEYFREAETIVRRQSAYRLAAWLGDGCILFAFREDSGTVARLTEELLPLAQENGFNLWTNMALIFRGWATADIDGSPTGAASMHDAIRALEDQEVDKSCYLGLLGKAYLRTGQFERADEAVRQGLNQANKFGEHYYTAELLRLRGEIELCREGDSSIAEASFREAVAFAQGQAARSWELKATDSLARLLSSERRRKGTRRELQPH